MPDQIYTLTATFIVETKKGPSPKTLVIYSGIAKNEKEAMAKLNKYYIEKLLDIKDFDKLSKKQLKQHISEIAPYFEDTYLLDLTLAHHFNVFNPDEAVEEITTLIDDLSDDELSDEEKSIEGIWGMFGYSYVEFITEALMLRYAQGGADEVTWTVFPLE